MVKSEKTLYVRILGMFITWLVEIFSEIDSCLKGWGFSGAAIRGGSGFAGPPTS